MSKVKAENTHRKQTDKMFMPEYCEIIQVSQVPFDKSGYYFVQKFIAIHDGMYYCERDDGIKDDLIGWKYARPNKEQHGYYKQGKYS